MNRYEERCSKMEPIVLATSFKEGLMHQTWDDLKSSTARINYYGNFGEFLRLAADKSRTYNQDPEETCVLLEHIADVYDAYAAAEEKERERDKYMKNLQATIDHTNSLLKDQN